MHPDILFVNFFPSLLVSQHVFDIYGFIVQNYGEAIETQGWFYYPPWTYFTFGAFQLLFSPFLNGFNEWLQLSGIGVGTPGLPQYLIGPAGENAFRFIFIMKFPYLIFDGLVAFLLLKMRNGVEEMPLGLKFWILNPVVIYSAYMFGQFDIIPALFILLSLYFAGSGNSRLSVLSLGIGGGFKIVPLILLPIAASLLGNTMIQRIKLCFFGLLPFLLLIVLLWAFSGADVFRAVFPSVLTGKIGAGLNLKMLFLKIIFITGYTFILAHSYFKRPNTMEAIRKRLTDYYLIVLLLLFLMLASPSFHYIVWITPVFALKVSEQKALLKWVLLFIAAVIPITIITKYLWAGLLAPLHPQFFLSLPGPEQVMGSFIPYYYVVFLAQIVFWVSAVWIIFQTVRVDFSPGPAPYVMVKL